MSEEIQMDSVQNGGAEPRLDPKSGVKSETGMFSIIESNFNVKDFLKEYKYEILLGLLILGFIICYLVTDNVGDNFNFIYDNNNKLKIYDECKFKGEGFDENWEVGECSVAFQIIPKCNNVLELGGGSGKVSHIINKLLNDKNIANKHLVLEPNDENTMGGNDNIYKNKQKFNDNYTILEKYAEDLDMKDLEILDGPPDCLYADCEGCLYKFFNTDIGKYVLNNVRFIVNEMDGFTINENIDDNLRNLWKNNGFTKIGVGYGCGTDCDTEVWYKEK